MQFVQILHSNEGLVALPADFIDRADVRMVQSGIGTRLAAKPSQRPWVLGEVFGQEF